MATMIEQMVRNDLLPGRVRDGGYAAEWAAYKRALVQVADVMGLKRDGAGPDGLTPLSDLDESAVALMNAAWHAGTNVGDAFARAELASLTHPLDVCQHCQGYGRRRDEGRECAACQGRGVVAADDGE